MGIKFGIFRLAIILLLLSSCLGTKHLKDDQLLLHKQKIKGNRNTDQEELEALYRQRQNKKIPFIPFTPYVWIYYVGLNNYNKSRVENKISKIEARYDARIEDAQEKPKKAERLKARKEKKIARRTNVLENGNLLMRWGEPLAIYDPEKIRETGSQIDTYLKTKGYFQSTVNVAEKQRGRRMKVTYRVHEGRPHVIDTFMLSTSDQNIAHIISENQRRNFIRKGSNYDQDLLIKERQRVEELLQNHGYFDFKRQYINYRIDTLAKPFSASIEMIITEPKRGYHKVFTIDSVIFVTDAGSSDKGSRHSEIYNKIKYRYFEDQYSKKILDQRIFIYPGETYSKRRSSLTQLQLANLDNFKFININYDTTGGYFIANIFTSNLPKYQVTNELGVSVTEGFPGPFYRNSLRNRNVFKGLENIELSGYVGFEGVASLTGDQQDVYGSTEAGTKLSFYFPQFIFPGFSKWKSTTGSMNPQTVLRTGFDFTDRPEYSRQSFNSSWIYTWRNFRRRINYNFALAEIGFINSNIKTAAFGEYLQFLESLGNSLRRAFEPSFVSSTHLTVTFNLNPLGEGSKKASYLRTFAEIGGLGYNFYNPTLLENNNLEYYQFFKGSLEYIRHVPLTEHGVFAGRVKVGSAYPYGNNNALPYEKYYFSGGSNSIRSWRPRRLGPGSYNHNLSQEVSSDNIYNYRNKIEQPGEILFEANVEYRSKLVGFVDWAYFIDVGNIWLFNEDLSRPGGNFEVDRFYKEIAVGSGLGLRLNFSFLIVRFDYAVKIYDPMLPENERFIGDEYSFRKFKGRDGQSLWNFAIGYPF